MSIARLSDKQVAERFLAEAMEVLETTMTSPVLQSRQLVGPVLDMWDRADEIGPACSGPLERLLRHLRQRHHTTREEVEATMAQVRRGLAAAS